MPGYSFGRPDLHLAPGVVYDVLGVNGARASRILSWNQLALAAVLANRKPDLIVIEYGTNEVADNGWTVTSYQRFLAGLLRRLQSAAPQASLILLGPQAPVARLEKLAAQLPVICLARRRCDVLFAMLRNRAHYQPPAPARQVPWGPQDPQPCQSVANVNG